VSPLRVSDPPPGGPDRVFPASRPSRGVVSCVALGLPGHPPKGVVRRYPPRGVLRDCSRPVPGSCRGVVSALSGGFPHNIDVRYHLGRDAITTDKVILEPTLPTKWQPTQ